MKRLLLIVLFLSGCVSPEQAALNRAAQAEQQRQAEIAYTQGLFNQCRSIGYQDGTDAQRNCVLQLHNQGQANRATIGAAVLQSYQNSLPYCGSVQNAFVRGQMRARGECR